MRHKKIARTMIGMLMAASLSQAATVVHWDFENSTETGTVPTDGQPFCSSVEGNGTHGTADSVLGVIMYGWSPGGGPLFTTDNLYYNGVAAEFTSVQRDGYVWDTQLVGWQPETWTIEHTVKFHDTAGWQGLISKRGTSFGAADGDFNIQKATNGFFRLNYHTSVGEHVIIDATNVAIQAEQWYGVAAASDGTQAYLYVNENDGNGYQLAGSYTYTNAVASENTIPASTVDWIFGVDYYNDGWTHGFNGSMDNVRFSDTALTPAELLELPEDPFKEITVSPSGALEESTQTLEAIVVNGDSELSSAELFLDGSSVAINNTPLGTTNSVSYTATDLSSGTHTGRVVVAGINPTVSITNEWTFSIAPVVEGILYNINIAGRTDLKVDVPNGTVLIPGTSGTNLWNNYTANANPATVSNVVSILSAGDTNKSIGFSWSGMDHDWGTGADSSLTELNQGYWGFGNFDGTVTLSQLDQAGSYDVYVYFTWGWPDNPVNYTITEGTGATTNLTLNADKATATSYFDYVEGSNYVIFTNLTPSATGTIAINATSTDGGFSAIQVVDKSGPTEKPIIQSIDVSGSTVTLTWTDEGIGTYAVQRRTQLNLGNWSDVTNNIPAGTGTVEVQASGTDQEFYQMVGE